MPWDSNGVPVIAAVADQVYHVVAPDGVGGVVVAWLDLRGMFATYDVRAQRLDANGNQFWNPDGARVCSSLPGQQGPTIVGNGVGGAIVSFQNGDVAMVAATRYSTSGRTVTDTDDPVLAPGLLSAWPNPLHERVTVHFAVARAADIRLEVFDVRGRRVHQLQQRFAPGTHSWAWDGRAAGADLPGGVYFARVVWPIARRRGGLRSCGESAAIPAERVVPGGSWRSG